MKKPRSRQVETINTFDLYFAAAVAGLLAYPSSCDNSLKEIVELGRDYALQMMGERKDVDLNFGDE